MNVSFLSSNFGPPFIDKKDTHVYERNQTEAQHNGFVLEMRSSRMSMRWLCYEIENFVASDMGLRRAGAGGGTWVLL